MVAVIALFIAGGVIAGGIYGYQNRGYACAYGPLFSSSRGRNLNL